LPMTLVELKMIRDLLAFFSDAKLHRSYEKCIDILNREVRLKEIDMVTGRKLEDETRKS